MPDINLNPKYSPEFTNFETNLFKGVNKLAPEEMNEPFTENWRRIDDIKLLTAEIQEKLIF